MPDLPKRRPLRLAGYNYSYAGAYFVTLCVEKRASLFGEVVDGKMQQNDAGKMIEQAWLELPQCHPGIKIDICQIMPDHFHGIIWLEPKDGNRVSSITLSDVVQRFKSFSTHLYNKGVKEDGWQKYPGRLWQRSFYDHVIRNEQDLEDIRTYMVNNPIRWQKERTTREPTERLPYRYK